MSYWLTDTQLFLYSKGTGPDDVHLWRCKKPASSSSSSSSLVVPMKSDDFDFVKIVVNHLELIGYMDVWDEPDYNRLVKYLYEKRFLVNSQGFVIAELLHKVVNQQDGNKMIDDANQEEVPAIYIRSLDVLPLKPYIPKLMERPIPLRTVKYLGDVNGNAAMMEEDSHVTKLTARVEHLEAENIRLESKINNTLDTSLTKLAADLVTQMNALAADMVTQKNALATLQRELENSKEVWMNDLTNSEWVGFENFGVSGTVFDDIIVVKPPGSFTTDDATTNVQARYWSQIKLSSNGVFNYEFKAICLEDLNPRREKARFSRQPWQWAVKYKGKTYVVSSL